MANYLPSKDPSNIEPYFVVWCDEDGTNDGSSSDDGELQGATISSVTWTVPTGITKVSDATTAATIHGVTYAINTVATIWVSGGTAGNDYSLVCAITTSDGRTLEQTIIIPVRAH